MTGTKIVKLRLEDGQAGKLPNLKDSAVDQALKLYKEMPWVVQTQYYNDTLEHSRRLNLNQNQVQALVNAMEEGPPKDSNYAGSAGLFLSAMVQGSTNKCFELATKVPLSYLGYRLEGDKTLIVEGDVEDRLGYGMKSGRIIVKGSARDWVGGMMTGGDILIEKDARDFVGGTMEGGNILVKGDSRQAPGFNMADGKIIIDGSCAELAGRGMRNGFLHVKGNAGIWAAKWLIGGKVRIDGNVGAEAALKMSGGVLEIGGSMEGLSPEKTGGTVFYKGRQIWPVETTR
ncbi:MAG: hypothetical protein V1921_06265 [Candidatus Altiarchaeota archaeon]